jgi:hypothetical protein
LQNTEIAYGPTEKCDLADNSQCDRRVDDSRQWWWTGGAWTVWVLSSLRYFEAAFFFSFLLGLNVRTRLRKIWVIEKLILPFFFFFFLFFFFCLCAVYFLIFWLTLPGWVAVLRRICYFAIGISFFPFKFVVFVVDLRGYIYIYWEKKKEKIIFVIRVKFF